MISKAEREYLVEGIEHGVRADGRARDLFRPVSIATGFLAQANGSSRVLLGTTDVVVGIKVEIGAPDPDRPDCGRVHYSVACSAVADPKYQGRVSEDLEAELTHALQRSASTGMDPRSLCIVAGKKAWSLYADCVVMNDDGNLLDALSIGVKAALFDTLIPHVEVSKAGEDGEQGDTGEPEFEVQDDESTRLDLKEQPIVITVNRVGRRCVVDLTSQEEGCASASLQVAVAPDGGVRGITKRGQAGLDPSVVLELMEVGQRVGRELQALVQQQLELEAQQGEEEEEEEEEEGGEEMQA